MSAKQGDAEQQLRRDAETGASIVRIQQEVAALDLTLDLQAVMTVMIARAQGLVGANGGVIDLVEGEDLVCRAVSGKIVRPIGGRLHLDKVESAVSYVAVYEGKATLCEDTYNDSRVNQTLARQLGLRAMMVVPLRAADRVIGVIRLLSDRAHAFSARDLLNVQILVESFGATIQQHRIAAQWRASEAQYRLLFDHNPHPMWVTDRHTHALLAVNRAAVLHYGYSEQEFLALRVNDLWLQEDAAEWEQTLRQTEYEQKVIGLKRRHRRKDGSVIDVEISADLVDFDGQPARLVLINDVTQRKAAELQIQKLAFFDPLTGLPNRVRLMDRLPHALMASTQSGRGGALLFIDLDNFKTLNDTLGHDKGDQLLQQVAKALSACVRGGDIVARLGGDEFVVVLVELGGNPQEVALLARGVAEKVLAALHQPFDLAGYEHRATCSIGVAPFANTEASAGELLKHAELAMYQAKTAGRNTLRLFDPDMQKAVTARAVLEGDLRQALTQNEFLLHWQPQMNSAGGVDGVEALVRWKHPQRGMVSPGVFIPLAEETGIILPLGRWVLETACTLLASWGEEPQTAHLTMAVNVSFLQFRHPDFVDQVLSVLERTGANPHRLKLELTESLLVSDMDETITKMAALKSRGVGFSLDDFGTGYSSLYYLKRLPLDQLKIDQSFVGDLLTNPNDAAIVRTIIALAQSLGFGVIAEGVENEAQKQFLAEHHCHAYQGYLFSRPLPADQLKAFLEENAKRA